MLDEFYENKYDIDKFLDICSEKDLFSMFDYAQKVYRDCERYGNSIPEYMKHKRMLFKEFVHEFLYYLHSRNRPAGMSDEDFIKVEQTCKHIFSDRS